MIRLPDFCTPIKIYLGLAVIIAFIGLALGIFFKGLAQSLVTLLINVAWMAICTVILWLICNYAGNIFAWIVVIVIAIIQLLALGGYMMNSII